MNFPALSAAFLLTGWVGLTFAKEPLPLATDRVSVELAAPPMEGTVSIGVFDATGKCLRVLYQGVEAKNIPSALNGFSVNWDGRDDGGTMAVAGDYEIRGVTVGNVSIKGEAWNFNDWIDADQPASSPISTRLVKILREGDFLLLQTIDSKTTELRRYHPTHGLVWKTSVAADTVAMALLGENIYLQSSSSPQVVDVGSGQLRELDKFQGSATAIAAGSDTLYSIAERKVIALSSDSATTYDLPAGITLLAACGNSLLIGDGTQVFQKTGDHFSEISLPAMQPITHLAMAVESSFWITTADASLTEFNLNGEPLRSLESEGEEALMAFDVGKANDTIALVSRRQDRERFRLLQLTASTTADVSLWKTIFQKDLQPCDQFGVDLATQKVVARGELPPEKAVTIPLIDNPLVPGHKGSISFIPASLADGLWLTSKGGLPLLRIAPDLTSQRMALLPEKKAGSARLFASYQGSVAEFAISGLSKMMQFSSEKVHWPPSTRQSPDEENVPAKEPAPTP